jgi:PAS domain S-box-containing protein
MSQSIENRNTKISASITFSRVTAILVMLVGVLVFFGWVFNINELKTVYANINMKANTAVSLMLAGLSLFLFSFNGKNSRMVGLGAAIIVALIGLLTLSQHIVGWDLHIDQLLFKDDPGAAATSSPGRMGITAASCFTLLGVAMVLLNLKKAIAVARTLAIITTVWALLPLVGYAYQAEQLFAITRYTAIALHTAIALFILGLGILAICIQQGPFSIVLDKSAAGVMARRLAVVGILAPFILGLVGLSLQRAGFFDLGLGTAVMVVAMIIIFLAAIWQAATWFRYADQRRLASEAIVRQGEERLRRQAAMIDLSHEPIFSWELNGAIIEWNRGCEQLYGYSPEEAIGRQSHDLLKTEFPVSFETFLAELENNGRWSGVLHHQTRSGEAVTVESRQQVIFSGNTRVVLETNRNVTERERAQQALRDQREVLRVTLSSIGDAVITTNSSGVITFLNPIAQSLTGWGDEAVGREIQEVFNIQNELTRQEVRNPALSAIREGIIVGLANHTLLVQKDGSEIPIDDSGAPIKDAEGNTIGAVLIFRDVTERRRAERSQALLAGIVESSLDAIVSKSLDGIIQSWNIGAERLFGYKAEEVIGKSITIIIPADRLNEETEILAKLRRGERTDHFETVRMTKTGVPIFVSLTISPIKNRSGEIIGASKIARDITERKTIEQERELLLSRERDMRADAQKASRIKDEFLATVSHELRTPLNAILGWATLLKRGDGQREIVERGIEAIERNAKAQAQLIEDLLDVSRIISGRMRLDIRSVSLTPIIQAAIDSVKPAADAKQIELDVFVEPAADEVRADDARLQQVLWNLLSNSIKFTPRSGKVQVRIVRSDSKAEIAVQDNGEGIREEFLPFIFDRFQQADSSYTRAHGGLGLGLAITRHLVEMHGGTIEAASEGPGQGATFTIKLPIAAVRTKSSEDEKSGISLREAYELRTAAQLAGTRILAVDDSADTRDLLRVVLERYGASVKTASSAREALEVMTAWKPDVLVCDIGMPEEDGYTFIQRVRNLKPNEGSNTPAIALTGYVRVEDRMRALEAGYQMFVPKPVEATELAALIGNLRGIV